MFGMVEGPHMELCILCHAGGVAYTAVPDRPGRGAPLRAVTVRDAIADLPPIENGHAQ
jgi:hypothetical protein